jgi:hypothetical protein
VKLANTNNKSKQQKHTTKQQQNRFKKSRTCS